MTQAPTWQEKAAAKRDKIVASIPSEWRLDAAVVEDALKQHCVTGTYMHQFLTPDEVAIVSLDTVPILDALKNKVHSAEQIARAFCKAAAVAHQINPCLLEFFPEIALERARELDKYLAQHGKPIGPLHGLPVSLKDQFHVKGVETSMGYVGWIGGNMGVLEQSESRTVESEIVTELLSLGAVLYCKTSVPQSLMTPETENNILGLTPNPHNRNLSPGGSSGGEGALLALRGSTVGFGTDIGGSVRIPAAFCGVYGLKPTPERISYQGAANTNPGQTVCPSAVGILATSLDGIEIMLKSLLSTEPWLRDPAVPPIPWRQAVLDSYLLRAGQGGSAGTKPLKFGVLWHDGLVRVHPPVERGLKLAVDAIAKAGHKLVNWEPPSHVEGLRIHGSILRADGATDIHDQLALSGEPLLEILKKSYSRHDVMDLLGYQHGALQGQAYEARYSDYWNSTGQEDGQRVDALLVPVAPHAAVIHGKYHSTSYTQIFNMLNYSSVVIPVTKADKEVDVTSESYEPQNQVDRANWEAYDPIIYDGAPVGIQIVGRKYEEEKVLAIAKIICAVLGKELGALHSHL